MGATTGPIVYRPGAAYPISFSSGEPTPAPPLTGILRVPPRTVIRFDDSSSETNLLEIEGTPGLDTIQFASTGAAYSSAGGIEGSLSDDAPFTVKISKGDRLVSLSATGASATMDVVIRDVLFAGSGGVAGDAGIDLDAHIEDGAQAAFILRDCTFTTDAPLVTPPAHAQSGSLFPGTPLVHLFANNTPAPGGNPNLRPTIEDCTFTVDSGPFGVPVVDHGLFVDSWNLTNVNVTVRATLFDGKGGPSQGIQAGINLHVDESDAALTVSSSTVRNCGGHGIVVDANFSSASFPATPSITLSGNNIVSNGIDPNSAPSSPLVGCGVYLRTNRFVGNAQFGGAISSNTITGNRVGIAFSTSGTSPMAFTIFGNQISSQTGTVPGFEGIGLLLETEFAGVIDSSAARFMSEANRIFSNSREGVLVRMAATGNGTLSPALRNERIYANGTTSGADGVRIERVPPATGLVAPTLVHLTVYGNGNAGGGFGVNNVSPGPMSTPVIWNSIVWGNHGPVGASDDLSGFIFGPPVPGSATVNSSDFCGPLITSLFFTCGSLQNPVAGSNGCISWNPFFANPGVGDFNLNCSNPPASPPCIDPPVPNCSGSECIDLGSTTAPFLPTVDALGSPRTVQIENPPPARPDMGALEKQTTCP